jgi:hypothetical protein
VAGDDVSSLHRYLQSPTVFLPTMEKGTEGAADALVSIILRRRQDVEAEITVGVEQVIARVYAEGVRDGFVQGVMAEAANAAAEMLTPEEFAADRDARVERGECICPTSRDETCPASEHRVRGPE